MEADLIVQRLARQGRRITPGRRRVIEAVASAPPHFTIEDILRRTPRVGRATVFRTFRLLLEANVVCRVLLEDGSLHYRRSVTGHHHHLVCTGCGRVEDFTQCEVPGLVRDVAQASRFQVEGHWLEIYGRCADCAEGPGGAP